jgi:hypothetical protein
MTWSLSRRADSSDVRTARRKFIHTEGNKFAPCSFSSKEKRTLMIRESGDLSYMADPRQVRREPKILRWSAIPLCCAPPRSTHTNRRQTGFDYPLQAGNIYEARRALGQESMWRALFGKATNDPRARSRNAVTLSSLSTTDSDQDNESS